MPYFCIFNSCHIYGFPLYCHSKAKCVSLGSSKTEFTRNAHARCIFTVFALCTVFTFTSDNSLSSEPLFFKIPLCSLLIFLSCGRQLVVFPLLQCQFKVVYFMNLIFYKFLQYCFGSTASKIQFHWSAPTNTGKVSTLPLQISFSYPHWRAISVKSCCVCIRSRKLAGRTGQEILWKAAGKANVWLVHVTATAL